MFQKVSGSEKFIVKKAGEYQSFPSDFFCLTVLTKAVGEPCNLSLNSGIEKSYASEGYVTIFCRIFFV